MTPELRGEILAQRYIANVCPLRLERILLKLQALLDAADARKGVPGGNVDGTIFDSLPG